MTEMTCFLLYLCDFHFSEPFIPKSGVKCELLHCLCGGYCDCDSCADHWVVAHIIRCVSAFLSKNNRTLYYQTDVKISPNPVTSNILVLSAGFATHIAQLYNPLIPAMTLLILSQYSRYSSLAGFSTRNFITFK